jgi:hypothetical protein
MCRHSHSEPDFTFYDTSAPPAVEALSRAFGRADGEDGELLTLTGSNFAPTGAALRCLFAGGQVREM